MVPGVQTEGISNILCQILHYYIKQYHDENPKFMIELLVFFLRRILSIYE